MKTDLMELNKLKDLLGCDDERTVLTWCKKNKIPVIRMGKKKYTSEIFVVAFIDEELKGFVTANYTNSDEILKVLKENDKTELSHLLTEQAPCKSKLHLKHKTNSKAAQDYINKFKAA